MLFMLSSREGDFDVCVVSSYLNKQQNLFEHASTSKLLTRSTTSFRCRECPSLGCHVVSAREQQHSSDLTLSGSIARGFFPSLVNGGSCSGSYIPMVFSVLSNAASTNARHIGPPLHCTLHLCIHVLHFLTLNGLYCAFSSSHFCGASSCCLFCVVLRSGDTARGFFRCSRDDERNPLEY